MVPTRQAAKSRLMLLVPIQIRICIFNKNGYYYGSTRRILAVFMLGPIILYKGLVTLVLDLFCYCFNSVGSFVDLV